MNDLNTRFLENRLTSHEKAFLYGIMITREGFNGECPFEHLSPDTIKIGDDVAIESEKEWFEECRTNPAIIKLLKQLEDKLNGNK